VAITIRGRGWPLSAVVGEGSCIFTLNDDAAMVFTSAGILSATTVSATNFSGSTATSGGGTAFSFTGGGSAVTSGGTVVVSGDRFLRVYQGGKTFYIACYASASTCSAL
jgi:hypothetical protein